MSSRFMLFPVAQPGNRRDMARAGPCAAAGIQKWKGARAKARAPDPPDGLFGLCPGFRVEEALPDLDTLGVPLGLLGDLRPDFRNGLLAHALDFLIGQVDHLAARILQN